MHYEIIVLVSLKNLFYNPLALPALEENYLYVYHHAFMLNS